MKQTEQRIAIAEFCGFTGIFEQKFQGGMWGDTPPFGLYGNPNIVGVFPEQRVPNYPNDLNAMHEATVHMREHGNQFQWLDFQRKIFKVIWDREPSSDDAIHGGLAWDVVNATAAQRAEAFLKTIGKWKDDPLPVSPVPHLPRRYRSYERAEAMVE